MIRPHLSDRNKEKPVCGEMALPQELSLKSDKCPAKRVTNDLSRKASQLPRSTDAVWNNFDSKAKAPPTKEYRA